MSQAGSYSSGGGGGGGIMTINANTGDGSIAGTTVQITTPASNGDGTSVFTGNGSPGTVMTLSFTDANRNVAFGADSMSSETSGSGNCYMGWNAGVSQASGNQNVGVGYETQLFNGSGSNNVSIGYQTLYQATAPEGNTCIGFSSGFAYTGTEYDNIAIGTQGNEVAGENGVIRIGSVGNQTITYMAGIQGVTPSMGPVQTVVIGTDGQLGSTSSGGSGITTINGDQGAGATGSTITIETEYNSGSGSVNGTAQFIATGSTSILQFNDAFDNVALGEMNASFSFGGQKNVGLGSNIFKQGGTGNGNVAIGWSALGNQLSSGNTNTCVGEYAGYEISSGSYNVCLGDETFASGGPLTGSYNITVGHLAGDNYATSEASNILLNASSTSVASEANTLRIGNGTGAGNQQLSQAFISGINGVNVGSVASVVSISGDQLGTTTITEGAGITVTAGANTITIANASPAFTWNNVTGASQLMAVNNGYIANDSSSLVTFTLPSVAAIGTTLAVQGNSADGWTIVENAGQNMNFGSSPTTPTTGYLASTNQYDSVQLVCVVANTTWNVTSSIGNLTVD